MTIIPAPSTIERMIELLGGLQQHPKKKMMLIGGAVLGVVVLIAVGLLLRDVVFKQDPNATKIETANRVTKEVGALYMTPSEEPTIVKIEDEEKLKDQSFFDKAENGDFLLIYPKAKQALIYRESVNKLVNAGPVNLPDQQSGSPQGATPTKK